MKFMEKNIGRITGLSSYELAVKNGTFIGTEEDYIKKENQVYEDMVKYSDKSVDEMKHLIASATDSSSDTNSEIVASRGEYDSLMDRLDDNDSTIGTILSRIQAISSGDAITDAIIDDDGYLVLSLKDASNDANKENIQLRRTNSSIQWRSNGYSDWQTLVYLRELMPKIANIKVNTISCTEEATGTFSGDPSALTLELNIPRGENGGQILNATIDDEGYMWVTVANNDVVEASAEQIVQGLPVFSIGTVNTVNSKENASASIGGSFTNPILNLSIPRGETTKLSRAYLGNDGFLVFDYDNE